jgi:hypothetical protein
MAWLPTAGPSATEGKMIRTPTGNGVFFSGAFYVLQTPLTAQTTNSASTLFTNDTTASTTTGLYPTVNLGTQPFTQYPGSTRILPPGSLAPGTFFNGDFFGVGTFTANSLVLSLGLVGPYPATTYTAIATTTSAAATASGAGSYFHINFGFSVTTVGSVATTGTNGTLTGQISIEYSPTGVMATSPLVAVSFDTTQQYTIDMRATWGGGSNSLQLSYGAIEVIG